jgi:hypothetical protein
MRKNLGLVAALAATMVCFAGFVPSAAAAGGQPTCLIMNGGNGETFSKSVLCAQLRNVVSGLVGYGHYLPGNAESHHLEVTVEFQSAAGADRVPPEWAVVAKSTVDGSGGVEATTTMVRMHDAGTLRACARVLRKDGAVAHQLCVTAG